MKISVQTILTTEDGATFTVEDIDIKKESQVSKRLREKIQASLQGLTIKTVKSQWRMIPVDGREHVNILTVYFNNKFGMMKLARGGTFLVKGEAIQIQKRSSATVCNHIWLHNQEVKNSGFCKICRKEKGPLESRIIPKLESRW